ncbi:MULTISPECIES: pyruvate ferredoxin oxidoreductase [unclassified Archaeoglobus]|jgi:pyruvate ferredoxin oxidoreductase alpha subunit|uniref:pyruvate ferredoxin oxidoreductase n=1 Tax=unclassified Archaeoglobus TaxID=2643606 RepID=UPI0025C18214|nr:MULTISPECIES: pyruvate ferredoxin oxidoreductase [unclassified Archaeoglobus]
MRTEGNRNDSGIKKLLTSNEAIAEAVRIAKPDVIAAYPITPQSPIVERLAEMVGSGELDASFVRVESEHSAMAVIHGAATAGARVFTATSSHGLAYMFEMCWWIAGSRLPAVMAVATRSIGAPWNIHGDHTDIMSLRDTGWIIGMAESAQEAFDMTLQAFAVSEEVNIPFAVGIDAFTMSHTAEVVEIRDVRLPERRQAYRILPGMEVAVNAVTVGDARMRARYDLAVDLEKSAEVIERTDNEFGSHGGLVEKYRLEDAEYAVVMAGGWCGDAKDAIDMLRDEGVKIGMLRLRFIRPFPEKAVKGLPSEILVVDRANTGIRGILGIETSSCGVEVENVVAGLGGLDVDVDNFYRLFRKFVDGKLEKVEWLI